MALVIGNGAYRFVTGLKNPPADATGVGNALEALGFRVERVVDGTGQQMRDAIDTLSKAPDSGGIVVLYYAGHGIQEEGENYLLPVDVRADATAKGLSLQSQIAKLAGSGAKHIVVILDACRNSELTDNVRAKPGLAEVQIANSSADLTILLSTSPGKVAQDGRGEHSPFTDALIGALKGTELDLDSLFSSVSERVKRATDNAQSPWKSSTASKVSLALPARGPARATEPSPAEQKKWDAIVQIGSRGMFAEYLREFPEGFYSALARGRVEELSGGAQLSPGLPPALGPVSSPALPAPGVAVSMGASVRRLQGHTDWIHGLASSRNGHIASASRDGTLRIWDATTLAEQRLLKLRWSPARTLAFSPDGDLLAVGGTDGKIQVFRTGEDFGEMAFLAEHTGPVWSVAFSPDSSVLLSSSADQTVRVWNFRSERRTALIPTDGFSVTALAFSPGGRFVAAGTNKGEVIVWEFPGWKEVTRLRASEMGLAVRAIAFNPRARDRASLDLLASVGDDGVVRTWTGTQFEPKKTLDLKAGALSSLGFSADGTSLAVGSERNALLLLAVPDLSEKQRLPGHTKGVSSVVFSSAGQLVSGSYDTTVRVWSVVDSRPGR